MGEQSRIARYFAEFLGTYILVLTVGCNALSKQPVWGGVSIACALMVGIYGLGKSSGANFNPAVSLALGITGNLAWDEVAIYMASQFAGGLLAGITYASLFFSSFSLGPTLGHTIWQAALAEIFYTFMLCFVVLNVAVSKPHAGNNQFYGLAIGSVVIAGAYGGGSISMGCFNPAVAFGIEITGSYFWHNFNCILYTVFEFIGALLAVVLFWVVRPDEPNCPFKIGEVTMEGDTPVYPLHSKLASEFIGTFMLVLTVGLNVLGGSQAGALSIAASLTAMVFALGSVSGAHFNPAVTAAIIVSGRGKCDVKTGGMYMGVQLLGGIMGGFTYALMMGGRTFDLKPVGSSWPQALIAELAFTFVLCFVVLSVATTKEGLSQYFGLAIGACVVVGGFAIGKVSGGSLNPAVSFGISSSHVLNGGTFWPCLIYSIIELFAGIAAVGAFIGTQPSEYTKQEQASLLSYGSTEEA